MTGATEQGEPFWQLSTSQLAPSDMVDHGRINTFPRTSRSETRFEKAD
jgi:hypothetical protein